MGLGRRSPGELPRWLVVPLVQLSGVASIVAGIWMLWRGNPLGLASIYGGQVMALRPSARPKLSQLLELVPDRRSGRGRPALRSVNSPPNPDGGSASA